MSSSSTRLLTSILLASLCGGIALSEVSAAPGGRRAKKGRAKKTKARGQQSCVRGTPTESQCLTEGYLDGCLKHKKACTPHLEEGFQAFTTEAKYGYASAPERKMLRPNGDAIPKDLRDGKFFEYEPSGKAPKRRKSGGNSLAARTGLTGAPQSQAVAQAKKAHRNPKWETNGAKARTCQEYAYEQTYDWSRFTDATAACRGNWRCQLDIALLPTTPGIADRTLQRKDGRPVATQIPTAKKPAGPKNDMFVLGKYAELFVLAGPPKKKKKGSFQAPKTPELQAVIETLQAGREHYTVGCGRKTCKGDKAFKDEWDKHRNLYARNKTLSDAEFEEYDRRKAEFNRLLDEWSAEVDRELDAIEAWGKTPRTERLQNPFEWVIDPYERVEIFEGQQTLVKKNLSKLKVPLVVVPNQGQSQQPHGTLQLPQAVPVSVMAAPRGRKNAVGPSPGSAGIADGGAADFVASIDFCEAWGNKSSKAEHLGYGPYTCRVGRFLRQEFSRIEAGEKSCLDLGDDDCDWSPAEFQARFVEGVPYLEEQQAHLEECEGWMPTTFNHSLQGVEEEIKAVKADAEKAWHGLKPYAKKSGGKVESLGKTYDESDAWGDEDFLGVDYVANVGWEITPQEHDGNAVCQLGGRADAGFGANAWVLGNKISMVSADVAASLNHKKSNALAIGGQLRVLGQSVFNETHAQGTMVYDPDEAFGSDVSFPKPKPTWSVMAGPVPVTGSVWGEIFYGVGFRAEGKLANTCSKDSITFGMDSTSTPLFMISALGQVGVGIGGVASAGVRGMVNLITFGFPVDADLEVVLTKGNTSVKRPHLTFDVGMDLLLGTLSGKLMLYIEVLFTETTFELFRWSGLKTQMPLMNPIGTELPLISWKK